MKKLFSIMSNLQIHYHFKLEFQNVDQHTGGKWPIHFTSIGLLLVLCVNGEMNKRSCQTCDQL